ncbi:hypothetical protein BYT27DRAFT_6494585 [Phlegmacium glaucopus]|nr:hypothetical protein BYT27DRAFT_6494585 [Phlegmacium glaucopus]
MVHLNVFNPARELRYMSKLILRVSKRILHAGALSLPIPDSSHLTPQTAHVSYLIKANLFNAPREDLIHDTKYYEPDSEGGFCIFRVEDTLFKVHRCYLLREPSAFGDMFSFPAVQGSCEGRSDDAPIPLFDTVEQFRDLLWVLYAIPSQLYPTTEADSPSLERLLNVAEMTNKYCIASYETWALDRILFLSQNPLGFLRHAPSALCARVLDLAVICHQQKRLDTVTQRLVSRMLWSDMDREPILRVAENRGLRKLQGVAYYKELVELEKSTYDGQGDTPLVLPLSMSAEKRTRFFAAHQSLVNLWESIRMTPPVCISTTCLTHAACLDAWVILWRDAGAANQTLRHSSADVLGRMKSMMIHLKNSMIGSNSMTLNCVLAALEAITTTRDDVIAGLMDHFQES